MGNQASTSGEEQNVSEKGMSRTLTLCIFLGELGAHRFYVGKVGTGILMLLTLGGLGVWWGIDVVQIFRGQFTDKKGQLLRTEDMTASMSRASKWFGLFMIIANGTILIIFKAPGFGVWILLVFGVLSVVNGFRLGRGQPQGGKQS